MYLMIAQERLKSFHQEWQSLLTITTEFDSFPDLILFSRGKKWFKLGANKTSFNSVDCIPCSSFKTAISYRRDFNLTKFSNANLNFLFISRLESFWSPRIFLISLSSVVNCLKIEEIKIEQRTNLSVETKK